MIAHLLHERRVHREHRALHAQGQDRAVLNELLQIVGEELRLPGVAVGEGGLPKGT